MIPLSLGFLAGKMGTTLPSPEGQVALWLRGAGATGECCLCFPTVFGKAPRNVMSRLSYASECGEGGDTAHLFQGH